MMIDFWRPLGNQQHASLKNARSAYCYKMPVHDPSKTLQNDYQKPFFKKHKSPHSVVEMCRGIHIIVWKNIQKYARQNENLPQMRVKIAHPGRFAYVKMSPPSSWTTCLLKSKKISQVRHLPVFKNPLFSTNFFWPFVLSCLRKNWWKIIKKQKNMDLKTWKLKNYISVWDQYN